MGNRHKNVKIKGVQMSEKRCLRVSRMSRMCRWRFVPPHLARQFVTGLSATRSAETHTRGWMLLLLLLPSPPLMMI